MNKQDLIATIAEKTKCTKEEVGKILEAYTETVGSVLKNGGELTLVGFGTFKVSTRQARTGRHPKTGEPLQIKASKVPQFKAGKGLKEAIA